MKTTKKAWNWFGLKKTATAKSLLNEQGLELMELKEHMLESSGTRLFDVLETKVYSMPLSQNIKDGLRFGCSLEEFEKRLLSELVYSVQDKNYQQVMSKGNLDECIQYLLNCKAKGKLVCLHFGEHSLYSDTLTRDSAYIQVKGYTEAQLEENDKKIKKLWLNSAKGIIREDKKEAWEEIVENQMKQWYCSGEELRATLIVSKLLKEDATFAEARKEFKNFANAGMSTESALDMIEQVSERGTDFVSYMKSFI